LSRLLPSKWSAWRSRRMTTDVVLRRSFISPMAFSSRKLSMPAENASVRTTMMKMIRARATSSSTMVKPVRRLMVLAPRRGGTAMEAIRNGANYPRARHWPCNNVSGNNPGRGEKDFFPPLPRGERGVRGSRPGLPAGALLEDLHDILHHDEYALLSGS